MSDKFLKEVPEFMSIYNKYYDNFYKDEGQYVIWGSIIYPGIIELVNDSYGSKSLLTKIFNFFEKMTYMSEEIKELLMYSTLELFGDDPQILIQVLPFMKKNTRDLTLKIEYFLGRRNNAQIIRDFENNKRR